MATQPQAPFWVPRPPDDRFWQGPKDEWLNSGILAILDYQPVAPKRQNQRWLRWNQQYLEPEPWIPTAGNLNSGAITVTRTQVKFYGQPGQAPTKLWRWDYAPIEPWSPTADNLNSAVISALTAQKFYGAGGQVPTKLWQWNYDPPPNWQVVFGQDAPLLFNRPFSRQWRYDHVPDPPWSPIPENLDADALQLLDYEPTSPAKLWRWDYVPLPDWTWAPQYLTSNFTVQQNPIVPLQWEWNYDPPPPWLPPLENLDADALQMLDYLPTSPQKLWRWDYEPDKYWQGNPTTTETLYVPAAQPSVPPIWSDTFEPDKVWQGRPTSNLTPQFFATPFFRLWRWDQVPATEWVGVPQATSSVHFLQPTSRQWRWDQVPTTEWLGAPRTAATLQILDYQPTAPQKLWRYDYELDKAWQGAPVATNPETFPTGAPFFRQWRWDQVPAAEWLGTPILAATLRDLKVPGQGKTKFWRWDNVPVPDWVGQALPAYTLQGLDYKPRIPPFWRSDYMPATEWVGSSLSISLVVRLAPPPPSVKVVRVYISSSYIQ